MKLGASSGSLSAPSSERSKSASISTTVASPSPSLVAERVFVERNILRRELGIRFRAVLDGLDLLVAVLHVGIVEVGGEPEVGEDFAAAPGELALVEDVVR